MHDELIERPWKDHNTRELINRVRDIAIKFHATQQLREQIAQELIPVCAALRAADARIKELEQDAARLHFLADHWNATYEGIPLHLWIDANRLRFGGLTAAIDIVRKDEPNRSKP